MNTVTAPPVIELVDPATGEPWDQIPVMDPAAVEAAISGAAAAFDSWSTTTVEARLDPLRRLATLLRDEVDEHALLISREMGKPIAEARGEVLKCALACDYYAENAEQFLAPALVETNAKRSWVGYEPIGLVLAIMPWNFPYWQVLRFAVPALTAGNGGLLKHAANVTGSALAIEGLFRRAGYPEGLLTTLVIDDHALVPPVIADPRVAAVTLTGSERAGAAVAAAAGTALKKTVLELGGSDPFIILADADLDAVVPFAVQSRFVNAGQSCLCAKRLIVEDAIYDEVLERIVPLVAALRVGNPLDPSTQIGPLAKEAFVDDIERQVSTTLSEGARLLVGGERMDQAGNYYAPTVLGDVTREMTAFREETFGPVLPVVRARDAVHAVELANDTAYGLAASIWTSDVDRGIALGQQIRSGALFVNSVPASDARMPFGGIKNSGYGRELSREGLLEFTNVRTNWIADMPATDGH
ncbi:NAD-dependent succinate-semialdehyde dehydrogenase [Nocardioides immobilis]|uniref:NAD-dependent succinate-semialdehyde dehydrogenase n=1 Tax=Nocardioides immobilis TaxID=2049295 RepID=A0A417XUV6_9ACTN|nr:NAD-dependent succinate-semialdehyde dehydrogenase [Nocardioides immobilis]RHW24070.1 NAD-dependent succinate-semialdehyde dehydrogenase [Nocardioides immobilis]